MGYVQYSLIRYIMHWFSSLIFFCQSNKSICSGIDSKQCVQNCPKQWSHYKNLDAPWNMIRHCTNYCKSKGLMYMGQLGKNECCCGDLPPLTTWISFERCDTVCQTNPNYKCERECAMSVYNTGQLCKYTKSVKN